MQATCSAEGNQPGTPRVDPLFDRHAAHCAGHDLFYDADHAKRGPLDTQPGVVAEAFDRLLGEAVIDFEPTAQRGPWRDPAEHDIGVGDGGFAASLAIARRSRTGACTLRPDAQ